MLLMFTMNYPDFDVQHTPRINVVFTGFSRIDDDDGEAYGAEDGDEEGQK